MVGQTVAVDLDGTLIDAAWPAIGGFRPGAIEAMHKLHEAGAHLVVWTARTNPIDPWGTPRGSNIVFEEIQAVRRLLDDAGLTFVAIHDHRLGKPSAAVYIDDRAERYGGLSTSWAKLVPRVLMRCKGAAEFPPTAGGY